MTKIRRVDLYSDDALTGTTELANDEMGVYVRVWLLMYATGAPITIEKLRSVCPGHGARFKSILNRLQALGKVVINGQRITCKRCEKEIQRAINRLSKASQNGAKGGRPNGLAKAAGFGQDNPTSLTSLQQPTEEEDSGAKAPGVAEAPPASAIDPIKDLWDRGKAVLGNTKAAGSLIGKLRKQHGDAIVLEAIVAAETELPSEPASFLIGCCNRAKANGHGRLTPANERFIAGREATYRAVLAAEERDREAAAGDETGDCD